MALAKTGYKDAQQGTASVLVPVTAEGYIATEEDTPAGTRRYNFNRVNAGNSKADNEAVLNFFIGMVGGYYSTSGSASQMKVTWDAEDNA